MRIRRLAQRKCLTRFLDYLIIAVTKKHALEAAHRFANGIGYFSTFELFESEENKCESCDKCKQMWQHLE